VAHHVILRSLVPRRARREENVLHNGDATTVTSARPRRLRESRETEQSRRVLGITLVLHFNIGKSKLSALPMTIRLVRSAGLIAFALDGTKSKRSRQYDARIISIVFPFPEESETDRQKEREREAPTAARFFRLYIKYPACTPNGCSRYR